MQALDYNDMLLLPLRRFLEMAEIHVDTIVPRDSAVAVLEPGHVVLRFNPGARILIRGADSVPYDTMDVAWSDGDLFVATGLLDRLLGREHQRGVGEPLGHGGAVGGLPVVQRDAPRAPAPDALPAAAAGSAARHPAAAAGRGRRGLHLVGDGRHRRTRPTRCRSTSGSARSCWGAASSCARSCGATSASRARSSAASWTRVWSGSDWIRQARLGDVQIERAAVEAGPGRRDHQRALHPLVGVRRRADRRRSCPAGWEVELYDAGRLMGYADANAVGAFRVPLQLRYGQNPVRPRAVRPRGRDGPARSARSACPTAGCPTAGWSTRSPPGSASTIRATGW